MKQNIFIVTMIISLLSFPLMLGAKGKPINAALLKDANGVYVGRVVGMEHVSKPYVLTDQGYRTIIPIPIGRVVNEVTIYFESIDCSGTGYIEHNRHIGTVFSPTSNSELAYAIGAIYYTPNDAQLMTVNIESYFDSDLNCLPLVGTGEAYPAYPNNPNITGIQNTTYPTRMLIE